jgi:hypothetical protein
MTKPAEILQVEPLLTHQPLVHREFVDLAGVLGGHLLSHVFHLTVRGDLPANDWFEWFPSDWTTTGMNQHEIIQARDALAQTLDAGGNSIWSESIMGRVPYLHARLNLYVLHSVLTGRKGEA